MFNCYLLVISICLFVSCQPNMNSSKETLNDSTNEKSDIKEIDNNTFYNITILLDLSDRIKKNNQSEKDKRIIEETLEIFQKNQMKIWVSGIKRQTKRPNFQPEG